MIGLAARGLVARRLASGLTGIGLFVATLGFLLLTGTSRTTTALVTGDVGDAWVSPYHLLIRPAGTATGLEERQGLVRPNFLSGVTGGITEAEVARIRQVPGVEVAAPIAVVGFTQWGTSVPIDLQTFVDPNAGLQALRIEVLATGDAGLSSYPPSEPTYLIVAPNGSTVSSAENSNVTLETASGKLNCGSIPWSVGPGHAVRCFGGASPHALDGTSQGVIDGRAGAYLYWPAPAILAGIDPQSEAELSGLDTCVMSGRYLRPGDGPKDVTDSVGSGPVVTAIGSDRSFVSESLTIRVERADGSALLLDDPTGLDELPGWSPVGELSSSAEDIYGQSMAVLSARDSFFDPGSLWTAGPVAYTEDGPDRLTAETTETDSSVYQSQVGGVDAPPEASDTWFRAVDAHPRLQLNESFLRWRLVGQYDPACIPGFDERAGYRLEAYAPPSARLPDGRPLLPTRNLAGYVNPPPTILTTLDGAAYFSDPKRYGDRPGDAFISAIRVKVSGVETPGPAAEAKLARVAADISAATGLKVDIVVGSSPRPTQISLAPGTFGRPQLTIEEGWAVKGVAVRFLEAVRVQDVAVFILVLVVAAVLVAASSFVSVRVRRSQFEVLRALGWRPRDIALLAETEVLLIGLVAGLLAAVFGLLMTVLLRFDIQTWQFLIAIPLAIVLAAVSGVLPALFTALRDPLSGAGGPSAGGRWASAETVSRFALSDLLGVHRIEFALGAGAVAIGSFLAGSLVMVLAAFRGSLDTSLLGVYIFTRVQPFHIVMTALTLGVALLGVAQLITLNFLDRQPEFAALRALGWPGKALASFLLTQAVSVGLAGGILAAAGVIGVSIALGGALSASLISGGVALAAGVGLGLLATLSPLVLANRSEPTSVLRNE